MECSVDTVKTNEDRNVMARHLCGNLWWEIQTETIIPSLHKLFGVFPISYTDFQELQNTFGLSEIVVSLPPSIDMSTHTFQDGDCGCAPSKH